MRARAAAIQAKRSKKRLPAEVASRVLRQRAFYMVEVAGAKIGLGRTGSYRAAAEGIIPTERHGKFLLVRKLVWDAEVKRLRQRAARSPAGARHHGRRHHLTYETPPS